MHLPLGLFVCVVKKSWWQRFAASTRTFILFSCFHVHTSASIVLCIVYCGVISWYWLRVPTVNFNVAFQLECEVIPSSNSESNDVRNGSMVTTAFWKLSRMCWSKSASYWGYLDGGPPSSWPRWLTPQEKKQCIEKGGAVEGLRHWEVNSFLYADDSMIKVLSLARDYT